jgi:surface carbohydrate biosynthesis protein
MKIGILVDNPKRDVWGSLFLADEAASREHEFFLIPLYYSKLDSFDLELDALIVNHTRIDYLPFFQKLHSKNIKIFILDTEGGLLAETGIRSPKGWAEWFNNLGISKYISSYFFWGDSLKKGFVEFSGMEKERLISTGHPRYDITSKYQNVLGKADENYILINGNFAGVNPKFSTGREAETKAALTAGWNEERLRKILDDLEKIWKNFTEDIAQLAKALPHENFLFRPHPFENENFYVEYFKDCPNITVECKGEVFEVINNSKCLIHLGCSTCVESILLNKLPIQLEYLNTEMYKSHAPITGKMSYKVDSFEHLLRTVENIDKSTENFNFDSQKQSFITPFFGLVNGSSQKLIIDSIENAKSPEIAKLPPHEPLKRKLIWLASKLLGSALLEKIRIQFNPNRMSKLLREKDLKEKMSLMNTSLKLDQSKGLFFKRASFKVKKF